jgi:sulfur-oxidizing protein SoxB
MDKRTFLKILAVGTAGASTLPLLLQKVQAGDSKQAKMPEGFYSIPKKGQARILHTTDVHGQLLPVYFREPNVNLGVGPALGRPPHIVGKKLLEKMELPLDSPEAYAYTYLDFYTAAKKYGKTGGYSHIKTLLDSLRKDAGGVENTITLDGGDLWQGSGTSLWTRGVDMVEASNILGVDVMIGHWEFTYNEAEVLSNVALFKGDFIGQNVRVKEDSLMDDKYAELVEKNDGRGLFDEDKGYAFQPYVMKEVGGKRIAVVGQAFPRTANANPPEFFPDWSFGLREADMADLVKMIRIEEKPDAVVMLSHNGMDVDVKMAENVAGIDAIFGGHTHDGMPKPLEVKSKGGNTTLVTNAGSNGKFVGVMDFDIADGKTNMHYSMKPVITNWLPADKEMEAYLSQMRSTKYDEKINEARNEKYKFNKDRLGKTYKEILTEKLAIADRTLYRRGNFMGTWDQVLCNALRHEYKADISFSAGVRWGTSTLKGDWITMEDVMTQCSMTYAETYGSEIKGKDLLETLEQIADNLFDPDPYLQSGGDMVRVGGLDYTIDPTKPIYKRITNARLDNGEKIEPEKSYKLAGWATVNRTPEGRLMWDVVRDYIVATKGKDDILKLPKMNRPKLVGVSDNPGLADYAGETG